MCATSGSDNRTNWRSHALRYRCVFIALVTAAIALIFARGAESAPLWLHILLEAALLAVILSSSRMIWRLLFLLLSIALSLQSASVLLTGHLLSSLVIANIDGYQWLGTRTLTVLATAFVFSNLFNFALYFTSRASGFGSKTRIAAAILYAATIILQVTPLGSFAKSVAAADREYAFLPKRKLDPRATKFMKDSYWTDGDTRGLSLKGKNVIVIFTEGLSSRVIDTENNLGLDLTPNMDKLVARGTAFENYFNHTAATYRGLRGQLTSFYQYRDAFLPNPKFGMEQEMKLSDVDEAFGGRLVSLPHILGTSGYSTYFLTSAPTDSTLNRMLSDMGFDKVFGVEDFYEPSAMMSDLQTFDALRTLTARFQSAGKPFFLGVYPSGTHLGMTNCDVEYRTGSNQLYNQFYNYDQQLGKFIDWLSVSPAAKDTVIVLTADHATYPSPAYKKSFRTDIDLFVDRIPLIIYGEGVKSQKLDARNGNSLSLAPTLLHLLGIRKGVNFFLGCSLFSTSCESPYSHISAIGEDIIDTSSGTPRVISNHHITHDIHMMYDIGG